MERVWPGELSVPRLVDVGTNLGDHWSANDDPSTVAAVHTGRSVRPGERIVFTCTGQDPHGRQLLWWLHPVNRPRNEPVFGQTVQLTWQVDPVAVGE